MRMSAGGLFLGVSYITRSVLKYLYDIDSAASGDYIVLKIWNSNRFCDKTNALESFAMYAK